MGHPRKIKLSDPLEREYNVIGIHNEDDPSLKFDLSHHTDWKDQPYNITIYDESDRSTLVSRGFTEDEVIVKIPDYSFGSIKAVAVVEDRSDPNNIDSIATIAYLILQQFSGGVDRTVEGHVEVENPDDSIYTVPYYSTGLLNP